MLVVDDSPEKLQRNYGNLICVTPFEGCETDVELALLPRFLHDLRSVPDVRRIEKRHWQRLVEIRDIRSGPWEPERR